MHFLRQEEAALERELGKPYAAVKVRVTGTQLQIQPHGDDNESVISVVRMDTLLAPLPERFRVVGPNGKVVKPSKGKRFWVTTQTIDPFHLVLEAESLPLR